MEAKLATGLYTANGEEVFVSDQTHFIQIVHWPDIPLTSLPQPETASWLVKELKKSPEFKDHVKLDTEKKWPMEETSPLTLEQKLIWQATLNGDQKQNNPWVGTIRKAYGERTIQMITNTPNLFPQLMNCLKDLAHATYRGSLPHDLLNPTPAQLSSRSKHLKEATPKSATTTPFASIVPVQTFPQAAMAAGRVGNNTSIALHRSR